MHVELVEQIKRLPLFERIELIDEITKSLREDLQQKKNAEEVGQNKEFVIEPISLTPRPGLNFDNIGKLIEFAEGDLHT